MDETQLFASLTDALKASAEESRKLREANEALTKATADAAAKAAEGRAEQSRFVAAEKARQQRYGGSGLGADRLMNFTGAGNAAGALRAGPAGLAAAGYLAVTAGLGKAAQAMDHFSNSALSNAQKSEEFGRQFVPGVRQLLDFRDAVLGVTDAIRRTEREFARASFRQEQRFELSGTRLAAGSAIDRAEATSAAMRGVVPTTEGNHVRSTLSGERAFQEEQRLNPAIDRQRMAEARAGADRTAVRSEQSRQGSLESKLRAAESNLWEARRKQESVMWAEYGGRRDKAGRQRTGRGVELAAEEVSRTELQLKEQALRVQEATTTSARSESAARKEGLAFMREQLANAQAREQAGLSQAQRIGRMTIMDRQRGSQAANMVLKHGIDKVSPQIVDTAERYAPGFIAKLSQDRADSLPEVIKDKKSGILDDVDFRQARAGQSKLRADIKVNVVLDEQALADKIVEALKKGFGDVIASVENRQKADEIKRRAGEQVRNNDANR